MPDCECIPACPFLNGLMTQFLPAGVDATRRRYCHGDKPTCPRYTVRQALGSGDYVPGTSRPMGRRWPGTSSRARQHSAAGR